MIMEKVDFSQWKWESLVDPQQFTWKVGVIPFSDLQVIFTAWGLYFSTILTLKWVMSNREPFKLQYVTAVHNWILTLWSLVMFTGTLYYVCQRGIQMGVDEIFCTVDTSTFKGPLAYIMYSYYLSKFYELFDTVILVLKKKNVIFLHWYHHAIVMLMVWSWLEYAIIYSSLGMMANTLIHVFMYYYYYLAALGKTVWFKRYLTTGQIIQFMTSFALSIPYVYYHFKKNCSGWNVFFFSMAINGSFLLLFINFYKSTYKNNKGHVTQSSKKKSP